MLLLLLLVWIFNLSVFSPRKKRRNAKPFFPSRAIERLRLPNFLPFCSVSLPFFPSLNLQCCQFVEEIDEELMTPTKRRLSAFLSSFLLLFSTSFEVFSICGFETRFPLEFKNIFALFTSVRPAIFFELLFSYEHRMIAAFLLRNALFQLATVSQL